MQPASFLGMILPFLQPDFQFLRRGHKKQVRAMKRGQGQAFRSGKKTGQEKAGALTEGGLFELLIKWNGSALTT